MPEPAPPLAAIAAGCPLGRKRPRSGDNSGSGAERRVLIYTTCYNVIDG